MKVSRVLVVVCIYYLQIMVIGIVGYGSMYLIYGGVRISVLAWVGIVLVGGTLAYIPAFVQLLRAR